MIEIISYQLLESPYSSTDFTNYSYSYEVAENNSFIVVFGNNIFQNPLAVDLDGTGFDTVNESLIQYIYCTYNPSTGSHSLNISSDQFMPSGIVVAFRGVDPDNEYAEPLFDLLYSGNLATVTSSSNGQFVIDFVTSDDYVNDYSIGTPSNTLLTSYDPTLPAYSPDPDNPYTIHSPCGISYSTDDNASMGWSGYDYPNMYHSVLILNPLVSGSTDTIEVTLNSIVQGVTVSETVLSGMVEQTNIFEVELDGYMANLMADVDTREVILNGVVFFGNLQRDRVRQNRVVYAGSDFRISLINFKFNDDFIEELHDLEHVTYSVALPDNSIYTSGNAIFQSVDNYQRDIDGWTANISAPLYTTTLLITWDVFIEAESKTYTEKINVIVPILAGIISEVALTGFVS